MSDLAEQHRRIADVLEPLEQMGIDATVDEQITDDGELYLTLELGLPPALESSDDGDAGKRTEVLEAKCERLREEYDGLQQEVDRLEEDLETVYAELWIVAQEHDESHDRRETGFRPERDLKERLAELQDRDEGADSDREEDSDVLGEEYPTVATDDLTDGERETVRALRRLGGPSASGDIADEVDATLQSVRSWLPKLVEAGLVQTVPDPTDGRRKLYSPVEVDEPTEKAQVADGDETVRRAEDREETAEESENDDETAEESENDDETAEESENDDETAEESEKNDEAVEGLANEDDTIDDREDVDGTVYIATSGGSPSQVFHVRPDCPQLQRAKDFVEKDRTVVPHHRPCGSCVSEGLEDGLVAVADRSPTETYHKREDCPTLESAADITVQDAETVSDLEPCSDCVPRDGEPTDDEGETDESPAAAEICARNDLDREAVIEALDAATAIYHVQRDLTLPREETEALLHALGVFEALEGGGHVPTERAKSIVREHVPAK